MKIAIRRMGNSRGVLIPKPLLAQLAFEDEVDMEVEDGVLVLRRPQPQVRDGWAQASKALAEPGEDTLVMGEFSNAGDAELQW